MINFIIRQDKKKVFLFATLQSSEGQKLLHQFNLPLDNYESFVLVENNRAYLRSDAALRLYNKLPWYWKWTQFFWVVPKIVRDLVYKVIAKNRYRWFGKKETCMIPTPQVRERFLM